MKACLSTIQQTLTPEAAAVLNQAIALAGRRNHGQTTPLHVASTLLASPTGFLRQACIRSHPNSSHPLQCRALELCFSVALERLPTTAAAENSSSSDPTLSNALTAALKRAQAHQRRGCPEQQQQPLLAVKVELIQFIVSILDDPSVSRVMREASFSSPAVKAAIEQSIISPSSSSPSSPAVSQIGLGFRPMPSTTPNRGLYLNPRLQSQQQSNTTPNLVAQSSGDDVRKVIEILSRTRKKNPVLVGESEPETVLREVLRRIEKRELGDSDSGPLSNVEVVSVDKELGFLHSGAPLRLRELGSLVEMRMKMLVSSGGGLILDLGDLKWLVDQPPGFGLPHQGVSEVAREAVADMGKLISRFSGEDDSTSGPKLWVIGTATCETYLRCQVYHPTMENEWDLQALSIAARAPLHSKFPRLVPNGILGESFSHLKSLNTTMQPLMRSDKSVSHNLDLSRKTSCCPQCLENYENEVSALSTGQPEKPVSEAQPQLPQWLQSAKTQSNDDVGALSLSQSKDNEPDLKQKSQELMKKWSDKCLVLHPSFHNSAGHGRINPKPLTLTSLYANPSLLARQSYQPKIHPARTTIGTNLSLNMNSLTSQPTGCQKSPPPSPVRTDLVLGQTKTPETTTPASAAAKNDNLDQAKDLLSCISSESPVKFGELQNDKPLDADAFKKLLKGLIEKVWWQRDAASAVTTTVTRCKLGNGRKRGGGTRGDIWMLFSGPDRTGKKKMVTALSEQVHGAGPVIICMGSTRDKEESDMNFRGKAVMDRIAEAVRRNPFSIIMLQDIDEAETLVRGSIKRAMERGRVTDSYGREISLGSIIFILTAGNRAPLLRGNQLDEEKLMLITSSDWHLRVSVGPKRRLHWLTNDGERASKQRRDTSTSPSLSLSFDLNELADIDEDRVDGSHNSSDLTTEYEDDHASASHEFACLVDESIAFKPVEFSLLRKNVERTITTRFRAILGDHFSLSIENEALDKILGGAWLGNVGLDSWVEEALAPAIHQLKSNLSVSGSESEERVFARLELDEKHEARNEGDWLPNRVAVSSMSARGG